jgi:hypothetical protein
MKGYSETNASAHYRKCISTLQSFTFYSLFLDGFSPSATFSAKRFQISVLYILHNNSSEENMNQSNAKIMYFLSFSACKPNYIMR